MISNYLIYQMSFREKLCFYGTGYLVIGTVVYLFYHSLLLSIACGFAIVKMNYLYEKHMVDKRMNQLNVQFKDMLYSMSASVAAGRQMSDAIIEACDNMAMLYSAEEPIMVELNHMKRCIRENNESDASLLKDFAERSHNEDINNFVQVYTICRSLGGNLENIMARTTNILSDKISINQEIKVMMSQKLLEGRLIAVMPPAMLLMLNLASPAYISPLYETIPGRIIMTLSLAAGIWGMWLIEKISSVNMNGSI